MVPTVLLFSMVNSLVPRTQCIRRWIQQEHVKSVTSSSSHTNIISYANSSRPLSIKGSDSAESLLPIKDLTIAIPRSSWGKTWSSWVHGASDDYADQKVGAFHCWLEVAVLRPNGKSHTTWMDVALLNFIDLAFIESVCWSIKLKLIMPSFYILKLYGIQSTTK